MKDIALLVARFCLATLFVLSGYGKLTGIDAFAGVLALKGFPAALPLAYAVGAFEFIAGMMVFGGILTWLVAPLLAAFCVATGFVSHFTPDQAVVFMKNVGLAGGFLALYASGPGRLSFDGHGSRRGVAS